MSAVSAVAAYLVDDEKNLSDLKVGGRRFFGEELECAETTTSNFGTIAVSAHVFFPEFIPILLQKLESWPHGTNVYLTCSNSEIFLELEKKLDDLKFNVVLRQTPNVGRNFAPLLVEFSQDLLKYDFFVHVHSKRTTHGAKGLGTTWASRSYDLLGNFAYVKRILSEMNVNPQIGVAFADAADLLRGINFRWGKSKVAGANLFRKLKMTDSKLLQGPISFPAGGMFLARTESVKELLELNWSYEAFSRESGQKDGTLQHAIERLFGILPLHKGYSQLMYDSESGKFTVFAREIKSTNK